jgi:hypothetical protein
MKHLSHEDLVLHYYGERGGDAARVHLEACETCRASFQALERVLHAMDAFQVPERPQEYGRQVWQKVAPRLEKSRTRWWSGAWWWFEPRRLGMVGAMAALLVIAFLAGRVSRRPVETAALTGPVRERIMLVAVGEHLEQSQMILIELVNNETKGTVDISGEQRRAEDLIGENRLYRQAAMKSGDTAVSSVLDELERVLLEIAHSPSKLDSAEFNQVRQRIEAEGILFKIRVVGTNLRQRERARVAGTAGRAL